MRPRHPALLLALLAAVVWLCPAFAQEVDFHAPANTSDPQLAATLRDLAGRILPVYQESDANRYLNNLSALQLVAGSIDSAWNTRQSLMDRRRAQETGRPVRSAVVFDVYMRAREQAAQGPLPFADTYAKAYQQTVGPMSDLDAYTFNGWLAHPVYSFRDALQRLLDQSRSQPRISTDRAIELVWAYLTFDAYRSFSTAAIALIREDDRRRYVMDDKLGITTTDGVQLNAHVIRPRNGPATLPALLEFTLGDDPNNDLREIAAHGYVGVVTSVRSRATS